MGFDSFGFYVFLYALVCLVWLWRASPGLLLLASLIFYAGVDLPHLPLLLAVAAVAWWGAFRVAHAKGPWPLRGLVVLLLLPLAAFKVAEAAGLGWAFPLGLS